VIGVHQRGFSVRHPTLHFLSGKLASGKTTLARRLAKDNDAVLVAEDIWLSKLFPGEISTFEDYLHRAGRFRAALAPHVRALMDCGTSVVLDFGGNVPEERAWVRSLCDPSRARLVLHYVTASDDLCKRQLRRRNLEQPDGSQATTDEEFESITTYFVAPDPAEGFDIEVYDADLLWARLPK
jgi:predicted kinase